MTKKSGNVITLTGIQEALMLGDMDQKQKHGSEIET